MSVFMKSLKTLTAAALLLAASAVSAAEAPLTRADIEGIVHDYIQAHPDEILNAVQDHQERTARKRQVESVRGNRASLHEDPLTPSAGAADADVTVVEFFDYNCGYCKKVLPQVLQLIEEDKKVKVLFKDFPILGPSSETASKWALAAHKQGKYFEMHNALMKNNAPITDALLEKLATEAKVDVARAKSDMAGTEILLQIERNRSLASNMDIRGTPAFIIGDDIAPGAINIDEMRRMVSTARESLKKKDGKKD